MVSTPTVTRHTIEPIKLSLLNIKATTITVSETIAKIFVYG